MSVPPSCPNQAEPPQSVAPEPKLLLSNARICPPCTSVPCTNHFRSFRGTPSTPKVRSLPADRPVEVAEVYPPELPRPAVERLIVDAPRIAHAHHRDAGVVRAAAARGEGAARKLRQAHYSHPAIESQRRKVIPELIRRRERHFRRPPTRGRCQRSSPPPAG